MASWYGLLVPKVMSGETLNPRTPDHLEEIVLSKIFTIQVGLNSDEQRRRRLIEGALQGNERPRVTAASPPYAHVADQHRSACSIYEERGDTPILTAEDISKRITNDLAPSAFESNGGGARARSGMAVRWKPSCFRFPRVS
jgi:hypothetical protein